MPIPVPTSSHIYDFYHSTIWYHNEILYSKLKADLIVDMNVAKDIVMEREKLSEGIARPIFVDISGLLYVDNESKSYLASPEACKLISGGVIYTRDRLLNFVGSSFILLEKPNVPAKAFICENNALNWLQQFRP